METYYLCIIYTKDDLISNPASVIQNSDPVRIQLDNKRFLVDNTPINSVAHYVLGRLVRIILNDLLGLINKDKYIGLAVQ